MRALVSGSSGFIGRALIEHLQTKGVAVHRLVRGAPSPGDVGIDFANLSLDMGQLASKTLDGIDLVFHLAGEPITPIRWSPKKKERIRMSRILTTAIIARALVQTNRPPAAFVCASAIGIYGDRGDVILDESAPAGVGFLAEVCRSWEAATAPARSAGVRVVNARTGIVLGADGGALAKQLPLFRFGLGGRLGNGHQWMSWISLHDEVAALWELANNDRLVGPCNLVSPSPVTNAQYTRTLAHSLHRPALLGIPTRAIRLGVGRDVASDVLLASQRVVPRQLQSVGFNFRHEQLTDALLDATKSSH